MDPIDIPQKEAAHVSNRVISDELFAGRRNHDLYWEALVQAAKNNKERAIKLVNALESETSSILAPAWKVSQPQQIDDFFDKLFLTTLFHDPITLSYLGLFESIGIREHNAFLTDISPKAMLRDLKNLKECLATLRTYSIDHLSPSQAASFKIFSWKLEHAVQGEEFLFHDYVIHQMHGAIQNLTTTFLLLHKLEVPEDVDHYIARLNRIPDYLKQAVETVEYQKQKGITPPRFALEKAVRMIDKFIGMPPEDNVFYTHLAKESEQIKGVPLERQLAKAKMVMKEKVYPAYRLIQGYLTNLLESVKDNNGVWALPNGDAYYAHVLKHHTTTNLTAEEIHELGLKEVKRIQDEMRGILVAEGLMTPDREVGELVAEIAKRDDFYYPNTEEGRADCLAHFGLILERCREKLWPLFDLKPNTRVVLKPVPKHEEEGAAAAYYYPASIDGSRPGAFYVNLRNMKELPKNRMETLAIHEAEPGHHFQCSIEKDMDIPALRKIGHFTAYTEGWALYVEKLAYEQQFYSTPFDKLGHLQDELLRAVRLVVDTGIHMKRWTREQAISYMEKATGDRGGNTVTEIERYFVYPGQACAYKVGQLKILELRQKAKDRLGEKFDIREFHNVILKMGSVPLTVLEEAIENYIRDTL